MRVGVGRQAATSTSEIGMAVAGGPMRGGRARAGPPPVPPLALAATLGAATSSCIEFHVPHPGHCPTHLGASAPHSAHRYVVLTRPMDGRLRRA